MAEILHVERGVDVTLEAIYKRIKQPVSKGYPPPEHRYRPAPEEWYAMVASGRIEFPDGVWHVDLPNRYTEKASGKTDHIITPDTPPTPAQLRKWKCQSQRHTTLGLAVHPLADLAFGHVFENGETIGMFTGPGEHWVYGAGLVGNMGLRRVVDGQPEYVVVGKERRAKDGEKSEKALNWSLPGGHAELGRDAYDAALDEAWEESGIPKELVMAYSGLLITTMPSLFGPNTAVAWLDERYLMLNGGNDPELMNFTPTINDPTERIILTKWMPYAQAKAEEHFNGGHLRQMEFFENRLAQSPA